MKTMRNTIRFQISALYQRLVFRTYRNYIRVPFKFARRTPLSNLWNISNFTVTAALSFSLFHPVKETKSKAMSEVEKVEEIYARNEFKEVYEYLLAFKDSEDPELLWRLVRASRDRACMEDISKDEKKKMMFDAFEVAKRALQFGEENYACHKWYGIMLSQTGDYLGIKQKLKDSPKMKEHFEKAISLNPQDATSHHLIGMWCFSFADLAWYERKIAAVVFGKPPESSYEEALVWFKKAEELSPLFYSTNQYMLGLANLKQGNKEEAKKWFKKLEDYIPVKSEDNETILKAREQLKSL